MGYKFKSKSGIDLGRPLSFPASDEQVYNQLNTLIDEGKITEIGNKIKGRDAIIQSISIEYGRINGTSYYFLRIPKYDINGNKVTPKVAVTSADGSVKGTKISALNYSKANNLAVCMNAGLFNTGSKVSSHKWFPEGPLVINGVDKSVWKVNASTYTGNYNEFNEYVTITADDADYGSNKYAWTDASNNIITSFPWMVSDMGSQIGDHECYPILIDSNGDFQTLETEDRKNEGYLPANLISAGYKYAVTGWGRCIYNYEDDSLTSEEIVHRGLYVRQIVGQFQNGDYFIFTNDAIKGSIKVNESGLDYTSISNFLIDKGARIAYSLDGGGSTETIIGNRSVNPIFESGTGRPVPTVIYWSVD